MVQETELQMNRWYDLNSFPVRAINIDGLNSLYESLKYLKGIELTEDILLKCGFEKWINETFEVRLESKGISIYAWRRGESIFITYLEYLHQLQNWYYLHFKNQELTINL